MDKTISLTTLITDEELKKRGNPHNIELSKVRAVAKLKSDQLSITGTHDEIVSCARSEAFDLLASGSTQFFEENKAAVVATAKKLEKLERPPEQGKNETYNALNRRVSFKSFDLILNHQEKGRQPDPDHEEARGKTIATIEKRDDKGNFHQVGIAYIPISENSTTTTLQISRVLKNHKDRDVAQEAQTIQQGILAERSRNAAARIAEKTPAQPKAKSKSKDDQR